MRDIARHSLVSLVAFALSSVLGLVIVGLVVGEYGLAAYGLIMLVRVLLPGQLLAIFSLGLPEAVTRAIARDLASGEARAAFKLYLAALMVVGIVGLLLALPLVLAAEPIAAFAFGLVAEQSALLQPAVIVHGAALPLLFAGVVAEGALRGQEGFGVLRSTELLTNLLYGLVSLLLIGMEAGPMAIALAYVGSFAFKAIATLVLAHRGFPSSARRDAAPSFAMLRRERPYARAQFARRFGSIVTSQAPRLVISHMIDTAAVGLYEALLRIPIFLRSLIAVINSVVMPVVVRMRTTGRHDEVARLAIDGPRLLLAMASLLALPTIALAEPLLRLWLGPEVAVYWPWFMALCVAPLINATVGFWSAMGNAELTTLRAQNRIGGIQAVILLVVALSLIHSLGPAAFWLAILCSMAYSVPALIWLVSRIHALPPFKLAQPIGLVLVVSIPAAALGLSLDRWIQLNDWARLLTAFAIVSAVQAALLGWLAVRAEERRVLLRIARRGQPT